MLEDGPVSRPAQGEDPGPPGQLVHLQPVQAAAGGDGQPGDKQRLVTVGSRLTIAGIVAAAVSLEAVVLLVMDYVLSLGPAIAAAVSFFAVIGTFWWGLPLLAAFKDRSAR